jgi:creatinine amidohydrolase
MDENPVLLIPVGAIEQHGPHLPLATDTLLPEGIIEVAAESIHSQVLLGVPIYWTYAPESEIYPGTLSLSGTTLINMVADLLQSYRRHRLGLVALVNGHMESYGFLLEGIRLAVERDPQGSQVILINWWDLVQEETLKRVYPGGWPGWEAEHAALIETSMALHLFPRLVDHSAVPTVETYRKDPYRKYPLDDGDKPPTGSYANTQGSSAEIGRVLIEESAKQLATIINRELK